MEEENISCYENRELSWLKFNERVLEEAEDINAPLCERLTFLSIFQSNLDEFFMVRVGSIHDHMLISGHERENKTNMTPKQQLDAILKRVKVLQERKEKVYNNLMEEVSTKGVSIIDFRALSMFESKYLEDYFKEEIIPLLSAIVVGKKQPFPFLTNKGIYALAVLESKSDKEKIGIIPCNSAVFERLIKIPGREGTFMLAEELILHFLPLVFKKYKILYKSIIRITRNADVNVDMAYDEDLSYCEHVAEVVKLRRKLSPVRLECTRDLDKKTLGILCGNLGIEVTQIFITNTPVDFSFFSKIKDVLSDDKSLFYPRFVPQPASMLDEGANIFSQIEKKDVLLFYPFESMRGFIRMLHQAAEDSSVISIKMTLYRLAKNSKIVEALIEAVENGKQVDVLVELKARFDEENNIEWARRLEDAGCHVIYGMDNLKVHSKLCLITRRTEKGIEFITQIGTGNYNEITSKLYTDLSLITADNNIGKEVAGVFAALSLGEVVESSDYIMVAPKCFQNKVVEAIDKEIAAAKKGKPAYIGIKINSLTDKTIMKKLISASQAGVKIDMIIRGINCLRSKIPEATDNIRVISIVGRYLEHSRIYIFGTGRREKMYISSADFMTRSTIRRVEVATIILDKDIKAKIRDMFNIMLKDNVKAREQINDGSYVKVSELINNRSKKDCENIEQVNSQEIFLKKALNLYK